MAGVWDALGAGIERGVAAYLQGREMQARRKTEEEEKARELERWIFQKMVGEKGLEQAQWEREQVPLRLQESLAAEQRQREAEIKTAETAHGYRMEEAAAERAGRPGKEPEKALYDKQGFNGEVALFYSLANQGLQSDAQLTTLLRDPEKGQALAESLVNRLVSTHKERWPGRNLEADFWAFFKARNPKLQSSTDRAAAEATRQQNLAQQQAAKEAAEAERRRLAAQPVQAQPALIQSVSGAGRPAGIAAPPLIQQSIQQPTAAEKLMIDTYNTAPPQMKQMYSSLPQFRAIMDRFPNLIMK